jgi:lipoic acid synthetase
MIPEDTLNPLPKAKSRLNILPQNPEKDDASKAVGLGRFPSWLHRKLPQGNELWQTSQVISQNRLHTVCEEARMLVKKNGYIFNHGQSLHTQLRILRY